MFLCLGQRSQWRCIRCVSVDTIGLSFGNAIFLFVPFVAFLSSCPSC
jgi:hypothetical protein